MWAMSRLVKQEDGFYLEGRKVEDGDTVLRRNADEWAADRIRVFTTNDGELVACFGEAAWLEAGKPIPMIEMAERFDLRWRDEADA